MRRLEEYVPAGKRLLRCGYTTGTCAAAATRAAADLLLGGVYVLAIEVRTPAGISVCVDVEKAEKDDGWARCAVRKDAGDDPDVTNGVMVYATVAFADGDQIHIDGGEGVGRVTKAGLDQPVGAAAINSVPRQMILTCVREAAQAYGFDGGLSVVISIPEGTSLARRTFNPRLGIEGGISVLGTTGIVRPMSEDALVSSVRLELGMRQAQGDQHVLVAPGNLGLSFARERLRLPTEQAVSCSNYVGEALDEAARLGFRSLLLVGHAGKLVKIAAGIMNTHSRVADGRAEVLAAHAAMAGAPRETVLSVMNAVTTDAMFDVLRASELDDVVMRSVMARIADVLRLRAGNAMRVEAVMCCCDEGLVGMTPGARELMQDVWDINPTTVENLQAAEPAGVKAGRSMT